MEKEETLLDFIIEHPDEVWVTLKHIDGVDVNEKDSMEELLAKTIEAKRSQKAFYESTSKWKSTEQKWTIGLTIVAFLFLGGVGAGILQSNASIEAKKKAREAVYAAKKQWEEHHDSPEERARRELDYEVARRRLRIHHIEKLCAEAKEEDTEFKFEHGKCWSRDKCTEERRQLFSGCPRWFEERFDL